MDIILNYDDNDYEDRRVEGGEDGEVFGVASVQRLVKEFRTRSFSDRLANDLGLKAGGGASKRDSGSSTVPTSRYYIAGMLQLPVIPTRGDDTAVDGNEGCGDGDPGTTQTPLPRAGVQTVQGDSTRSNTNIAR